MQPWSNCKNILCIRADNMGDLIMSSPAFRALKESFNCKITVLTSSMGGIIAPFIPEIDEILITNLPWVKTNDPVPPGHFQEVITGIRKRNFDAAIVFTVYSQNPLPAAMLAYLAGIPRRLAYCRENPYNLLTDWVVEKEPFQFIRHQVERDLHLVSQIGAQSSNHRLQLNTSSKSSESRMRKLKALGVNTKNPWIVLHPGVSEEKRMYPVKKWIEAGKSLQSSFGCQLLISGSVNEKKLATQVQQGIGEEAFCIAGELDIAEFIDLIKDSALVISVNTGTVHIAAATNTPVIVLYALTNPQHTPWMVPHKTLYYSVDEALKSKNDIINFVTETIMEKDKPYPTPEEIVTSARELLSVRRNAFAFKATPSMM